MVHQCLKLYERASGQFINFQKSSITFSANVDVNSRKVVCYFLIVKEGLVGGCYLGLPSFVGRNKFQVFSFVRDKAWARIQNWKRKNLSRVGKEILLKSIIQAVPSYIMIIFNLPCTMVRRLEAMIKKFVWSQAVDRKRIH